MLGSPSRQMIDFVSSYRSLAANFPRNSVDRSTSHIPVEKQAVAVAVVVVVLTSTTTTAASVVVVWLYMAVLLAIVVVRAVALVAHEDA